MSGRTLLQYPEPLAVVSLGAGADVPAWAQSSSLLSVSASAEETSVVCAAESVPAKARPQGPYAAFAVAGTLHPGEVGILAGLLSPLAEAGIPVFVVSTFRTDWVLVPAQEAPHAGEAWRAAGYDVAPAPAHTARTEQTEHTEHSQEEQQ